MFDPGMIGKGLLIYHMTSLQFRKINGLQGKNNKLHSFSSIPLTCSPYRCRQQLDSRFTFNRPFAQLLSGLETGRPVMVGQSPAYDFSVSTSRKLFFLSPFRTVPSAIHRVWIIQTQVGALLVWKSTWKKVATVELQKSRVSWTVSI